MGFVKEFKEFALKGNLVDITVAFVMGAAFGRVVTSLTEGIITPLVGLVTGGVDLSQKAIIIKKGSDAVKDASGKVVTPAIADISIKWGAFITSIIDFLIVALVMFIIIKAINNSKKKKEEAAPAAPEYTLHEKFLMEIRAELKK